MGVDASQFFQIMRGKINRDVRRRLAPARTVFIRSRDMTASQPAAHRMREVTAVSCNHHALGRREIKRLTSGEIDARLGFEIAGNLRAKYGVPRKSVTATMTGWRRASPP